MDMNQTRFLPAAPGWPRALLIGALPILLAGVATAYAAPSRAPHHAAPPASSTLDLRAAAAAPRPGTPADAAEVVVDNFTYQPKALTIAAGTTVTWTNHDDI